MKRNYFLWFFFCLLLTSCHSYRLSVHTLKDEFSLQNDTLKFPRMENVRSVNTAKKAKLITLKPNQTITAILKTPVPEKDPRDTLRGVRRVYIPKQQPVYPKRISFYADDAYIKQDTLFAYRNCAYCDTIRVPLDSIDHIEIASDQISRKYSRKNAGWFNPSYANEINGLSFSLWTTTGMTGIDTLKINGMNMGIEVPWAAISLMAAQGVAILPFVGFAALFVKNDTTKVIKPSMERPNDCNRICPPADTSAIIIRGFNLGILGSPIEPNTITGLNICGIGTYSDKLKGVSLTGLVTVSKDVEGVCISGLVNHTKRGRGVQIGLTNFATDFKGIQIGLWNKIGKLGLPFINLRFKKEKQIEKR